MATLDLTLLNSHIIIFNILQLVEPGIFIYIVLDCESNFYLLAFIMVVLNLYFLIKVSYLVIINLGYFYVACFKHFGTYVHLYLDSYWTQSIIQLESCRSNWKISLSSKGKI